MGYRVMVTGTIVGEIAVTERAVSGVVGPGDYTVSIIATNPCGSGAATTAATMRIP
jgi:hypothetical protein